MTFAHRLTYEIWQRHGFWGRVGWLTLAPLSLGFSALVRGRNLLYDRHWLPSKRPPLQVISVGNLTVGGTGKTPLVLWLAQALQNRGHRVGILSRGYGGKNPKVTVVGTTGQALATPAEVGDEPVMLARAFAGVVIAGRDRVAAAWLACERFGLDVVILDDGFQHRRLERDVDLLGQLLRDAREVRVELPAAARGRELHVEEGADLPAAALDAVVLLREAAITHLIRERLVDGDAVDGDAVARDVDRDALRERVDARGPRARGRAGQGV